MAVTIRVRRPDDEDMAGLVAAHVAEMDADETPAEACHRLDVGGLLAPHITVFGASDDGGALVGMAALADHGDEQPPWGEVKSMHVVAPERGRGLSWALLDHVCHVARERGLRTLRLETARSLGPAVGLYRAAGFVERAPFGAYDDHPASLFMELDLTAS